MANVETRQPVEQVPWGLIATACDYRLRFYFPWQGITNLAAYRGAQIAGEHISTALLQVQGVKEKLNSDIAIEQLNWRVANKFFVSLQRFVGRVQPAGRRLNKADEDTLLRYCIVLAAFDIVSGQGFDERSVLLTPQLKTSLKELLSVAELH
jgi:hypothetical protein